MNKEKWMQERLIKKYLLKKKKKKKYLLAGKTILNVQMVY